MATKSERNFKFDAGRHSGGNLWAADPIDVGPWSTCAINAAHRAERNGYVNVIAPLDEPAWETHPITQTKLTKTANAFRTGRATSEDAAL